MLPSAKKDVDLTAGSTTPIEQNGSDGFAGRPYFLQIGRESKMKGIVFNLLEEVVCQEYGEVAWESVLESAGLDGSYTSLGNYPDEHLFKLVSAASAALGQPADAVVRSFGRKALPLLAKKYAVFFSAHQSTRPFLLTLNSIIHPEVRKLYPGAEVPDFDFDVSSPEVLVMGYRSQRKLCALAEGFIEGAASHFDEEVRIEHPECMHRGDPSCLLKLVFRKKGA